MLKIGSRNRWIESGGLDSRVETSVDASTSHLRYMSSTLCPFGISLFYEAQFTQCGNDLLQCHWLHYVKLFPQLLHHHIRLSSHTRKKLIMYAFCSITIADLFNLIQNSCQSFLMVPWAGGGGGAKGAIAFLKAMPALTQTPYRAPPHPTHAAMQRGFAPSKQPCMVHINKFYILTCYHPRTT